MIGRSPPGERPKLPVHTRHRTQQSPIALMREGRSCLNRVPVPPQERVFTRTMVMLVIVAAVPVVAGIGRAAEVVGRPRRFAPLVLDRLGMGVDMMVDRPAVLMGMHMCMPTPDFGFTGPARQPKDRNEQSKEGKGEHGGVQSHDVIIPPDASLSELRP